jgi:hypothetical protein
MHAFPLHQTVETECHCCRLLTVFVFTSPSDHVVCKACLPHQGDTSARLTQRNFGHVNLWRSEFALA